MDEITYIIFNGINSEIEILLDGRKNVIVKNYNSISEYVNFLKKCEFIKKEDVFIINIELITDSQSHRNDFLGIELLKWFRYERKLLNKIVLTGFTELGSILSNRPKDILILSKGNCYLQLPFKPSELNKIILNLAPINEENYYADLATFVAADFNLKNITHSLSNNLGLNILALAYYYLYLDNDILDEKQSFIIERIQIMLGSLEIYKSSILYNYNLSPTNFERRRIVSFKEKIQSHLLNSKILYIDDQSENGWGKLLSLILFNNLDSIETVNIDYKNISVTEISKSVLRKINDYKPDVVLLDLYLNDAPSNNLKSISGIEVLKEIKKSFGSLPVIITSATNKASKMEMALKNGAETLWSKPRVEDIGFSIYKSYLDLIKKVHKAFIKFEYPIQKKHLDTELILNSINEKNITFKEKIFIKNFDLIVTDTNCWMFNRELEKVTPIYTALYKTAIIVEENIFYILDDIELELLDHIQNKGLRHNEEQSIAAKFGLDLIAKILKINKVKPYVKHLKYDYVNRFQFVYSSIDNPDSILETCIDSQNKYTPASRIYYNYENIKSKLLDTKNEYYRGILTNMLNARGKDFNKLTMTNHHRAHADDSFINIIFNAIENYKFSKKNILFISDDVECRDNIYNLIDSKLSLNKDESKFKLFPFVQKDKNGVLKVISGSFDGINSSHKQFKISIVSPDQFAEKMSGL